MRSISMVGYSKSMLSDFSWWLAKQSSGYSGERKAAAATSNEHLAVLYCADPSFQVHTAAGHSV